MSDSTITVCVVVPLFIIAMWMILSNIFLLLRGERTTGIVVDYEARRGSKGGTTHAEVVEFKTDDGKTIRFAERASRTRFVFRTGHSVNVIYDPDKPHKARINSFFALYITPIILLVVGSCLFVFNLSAFSGLGEKLLNMLQDFIEKVPFL